jgi:5'-methylthioadenosine phosphorylase
MIGIIGGSGVYEISGLIQKETKKISTPFGDPSDEYRIGELSGIETAFLARHGAKHQIPPHKVNYRANIWGFKELGVERIITVNAVGGINPELAPGQIVILDQMIDFTDGRKSTFYEDEQVVHVDFTEPYCSELRHAIHCADKKLGIVFHNKGTYIAVNGPRLETAAEIRAFANLGADVVGMTGMPEAILARELGICLAGIAIVTNYAAGIAGNKLTTKEVVEKMAEMSEKVKAILKETFSLIPSARKCSCKDALAGAKM